jgi:hypothetical protein
MGPWHAVRRLGQGCRGGGGPKPLVVPRKRARAVNPFASLTLSRFFGSGLVPRLARSRVVAQCLRTAHRRWDNRRQSPSHFRSEIIGNLQTISSRDKHLFLGQP